MSDTFVAPLTLDRAASGRFAVVGVGETDYGDDYRAARSGAVDRVLPDGESLGRRAFERALSDSGLVADIDGLCASFTYGGPEPAQFPAAALGLTPRHVMRGGGMMPFLAAVQALAAGLATPSPLSILASRPSAGSTAARRIEGGGGIRTTTITLGGGARRPPTGP